jgi:nitroreductase
MMNETMRVIHGRRSVRSYSGRPVTRQEKDLILEATFRAPTAGNMMLYSIIEIEAQAIKDRLTVTCDNQPFIARAPYVLLFLADYQRWFDYFIQCGVEESCRQTNVFGRTPQAGDLLLACCDALIAAQTAVLAAESMGIGSCYIGDILENYEIHRDLFDLPPYTLPITMLCFGYPAAPARVNQSTRFDKSAIVHVNKYRRLGAQEFTQAFSGLEKAFAAGSRPSKFENAGQAFYFRKFVSDFSVEMNRSVNEMLKNWK